MTNEKTFLAKFFDWLREIIESAESPFSLFARVVLPILAPIVPAFITGVRMRSEVLGADLGWLAWTTAVTLELLGYAGAITFIKSISRFFRGEGSFLSVVMYGGVYAFYVTIMYLINVRLGFMAGDSEIINQIFALLSFITIPTGILAAEHINEREKKEEIEKKEHELKEEKERRRQERREDRKELERLKLGLESSESSEKVSKSNGKSEESFQKVSDWRKVRPQLSREQLERIANLSPAEMTQYASETHLTYKTISNWRKNARRELGVE